MIAPMTEALDFQKQNNYRFLSRKNGRLMLSEWNFEQNYKDKISFAIPAISLLDFPALPARYISNWRFWLEHKECNYKNKRKLIPRTPIFPLPIIENNELRNLF